MVIPEIVPRVLHSFLRGAIILALLGAYIHPFPVLAAPLAGMSSNLSDSTAGATAVTYLISFTTATTDDLHQIELQFSTAPGNSTKPAGLDLSGSSLAGITGMNPSWTLNTSSASTGLLVLERGSTTTVNASTAVSIELDNITNSAINDCEPSHDILRDSCSIKVTTYSDTGTTEVDSGTTVYTVEEDPELSFEIEDVPASETHNGVTSTVSSTDTSISFGRLVVGQPAFATHKLTISTNAPHGYIIYASLENNLHGQYAQSEIDPFGGVDATWSTPQNWSSPNGTTANENTGWFGANTSDTRVSGWASAANKFAPLSTIPRPVAYSTEPDISGTIIYVSYALEINSAQPSDSYSGNILYDVQARY